jgi:protein involved in polysaccharide export with SLBB domain
MINNQEEEQSAQIREELMKRKDLVGIRLDKIIDDSDEKTNLYLEEGDIIFVPKTLQTVTVGGAVQVPGMEVYGQKGLRKYIRGAGGFTKKARKSGVYVAYSNGEVKSTRRFLWMKNYPDVKPGAHIYVPEKPERNSDDSKSNATFFVSLFSSMATMASVVVSAISVMSK